MGEVILSMMITVDGFVCGANGELDWVVWEEEMDRDAITTLERASVIVVGYGAYTDMAEYWPMAATNPKGSAAEREFAQLLNEKRKIVFSRSGRTPIWKNDHVLVPGDLGKAFETLRAAEKTIVVYGGVSLARELAELRLINEYRLLVSPVVLGKGKRLFEELEQRIHLKAVHSKIYLSGAAALWFTDEHPC